MDVTTYAFPYPDAASVAGNEVSFVKLIEADWRIYSSVNRPSLVQIMACRLVGAKPLSEPMMEYC